MCWEQMTKNRIWVIFSPIFTHDSHFFQAAPCAYHSWLTIREIIMSSTWITWPLYYSDLDFFPITSTVKNSYADTGPCALHRVLGSQTSLQGHILHVANSHSVESTRSSLKNKHKYINKEEPKSINSDLKTQFNSLWFGLLLTLTQKLGVKVKKKQYLF